MIGAACPLDWACSAGSSSPDLRLGGWNARDRGGDGDSPGACRRDCAGVFAGCSSTPASPAWANFNFSLTDAGVGDPPWSTKRWTRAEKLALLASGIVHVQQASVPSESWLRLSTLTAIVFWPHSPRTKTCCRTVQLSSPAPLGLPTRSSIDCPLLAESHRAFTVYLPGRLPCCGKLLTVSTCTHTEMGNGLSSPTLSCSVSPFPGPGDVPSVVEALPFAGGPLERDARPPLPMDRVPNEVTLSATSLPGPLGGTAAPVDCSPACGLGPGRRPPTASATSAACRAPNHERVGGSPGPRKRTLVPFAWKDNSLPPSSSDKFVTLDSKICPSKFFFGGLPGAYKLKFLSSSLPHCCFHRPTTPGPRVSTGPSINDSC
mmetsp:Transcript_34374/g.99831  ORF Transcript_34374/g.99831 Transcript_34374/m.99831 type:complete len:375 (-) Transcript_34374:29-1153(-)